MEINYYRQTNAQGVQESWNACQFTSDTDLTAFTARPLVTINGQPILRQHHITYLTGKETCRAHHFAKHLAIQLLSNSKDSDGSKASDSSNGSDSVSVASGSIAGENPEGCGSSTSHPRPRCKVLWIDTLHGPHVAAAIYRELAAHATSARDLHFICFDILGGQREEHWYYTRCIEALIKRLRPQLVVIDDIDHFMPHCGINLAIEFNRAVRDVLNHSDTAFLFIGYNHLGKRASTTGNLGKELFTSANDIFAVSTQRDITTVRHAYGYDMRHDPEDTQFRFTIGPDNLPREVDAPAATRTTGIDDDALRDIVNDILQPGQSLTKEDFHHQVTTRHRHLKKDDRTTALLNQALRLHLITVTPTGQITQESPSSKASEASTGSDSSMATSDSVSVGGGFVAVKSPKGCHSTEDIPEGCDSSTSLPPMAGDSIKAGETSTGGDSIQATSDSVGVASGSVAGSSSESSLSRHSSTIPHARDLTLR